MRGGCRVRRRRRGDELPEWVRNKQRRLENIRAARAALEAEAKAAAAAKPGPDKPDGSRVSRAAAARQHPPEPKATRSATSPIPRAGS